MKKLNNIIIFISLITLMFSACKKESTNKIAQTSGDEVYWTQEDLKIQNQILNFQEKVKNNNFKNGETITLDSAIWYMEAGINFSYCFTDTSIMNEIIDTVFFELQVSNDEVLISSIQEAYQNVEESVIQNLNGMNSDHAIAFLSDFSIIDNDLKTDTKTAQVVTIYGIETNPAYPGSSCYGDYEFTSPMHFTNAAAIFQNYINNPQCPQIAYDYVTNIEWRYVAPNQTNYDYLNPDDTTPEDNYFDYLFFYQYEWWPNDHETMSADELNFYFDQIYQTLIPQKLADIESTNPTGRSFISALIWWEQSTWPMNQTIWHHNYKFTFGNKRIRINNDPSPID